MIFSLPLLSLIYIFTSSANAYHIPRLHPNNTFSDTSISPTATSTRLTPRSTGDESISTGLIVVIVGGGFILSLVFSFFGIYKTLCSSSRRGSSRYVPTHAELIACWDRFGNSPWNRNGNVRVIGGQLINLGPPRLGCEVGLEELREFWRLSGHRMNRRGGGGSYWGGGGDSGGYGGGDGGGDAGGGCGGDGGGGSGGDAGGCSG